MKYGHVRKRYLLLLVMLGLVTGCGKETLAKKSTDENGEVKKIILQKTREIQR